MGRICRQKDRPKKNVPGGITYNTNYQNLHTHVYRQNNRTTPIVPVYDDCSFFPFFYLHQKHQNTATIPN